METGYRNSANFLEVLSYSLKDFAELIKQYPNKRIDFREELLKVSLYLISEVRKNGSNQNILLDLFPKAYRPVAEAIIEKYKKEPWDVTVDFISSLVKEFGKDREKGVYRPTEEVLRSAVKKFIAGNLLKDLFNL